MIEALAAVMEAAKEVAVSSSECRIAMDVIEDMREMLKSVTSEVTDAGAASIGEEGIISSEEEAFAQANLEINAEYVKGGHLYETDGQGEIAKVDGEYLNSYEDRVKRTPVDGERGNWSGERGESKYTPDINNESGAKAAEKLKEYNLDGIEYKDGYPDFSECSEETVEIDMTDNRPKNFEKAYEECAKKWNERAKDGRTDWIKRDVQSYKETNKLTVHECEDRKTCQLVSTDIHEFFRHSGGYSECVKSAASESLGGIFDE